MHRIRNAALVTALFVTGPALAGTPAVNSGGFETPSTDVALIPVVGEVTPTPGLGSAAVPATGGAAVAEAQPGTPFETLVADFRWGVPDMGAVPYLPVPPPFRMRAEEAGTESAEDGSRAQLDRVDPSTASLASPTLSVASPDTPTPEREPTVSN
jgi:hypothetical protein